MTDLSGADRLAEAEMRVTGWLANPDTNRHPSREEFDRVMHEYDRRGGCLQFISWEALNAALASEQAQAVEAAKAYSATCGALVRERDALRAARDRVLAYLDEREARRSGRSIAVVDTIRRLLAVPQDEKEGKS